MCFISVTRTIITYVFLLYIYQRYPSDISDLSSFQSSMKMSCHVPSITLELLVLQSIFVFCGYSDNLETVQASHAAGLFILRMIKSLRAILSLWPCKFTVNALEIGRD